MQSLCKDLHGPQEFVRDACTAYQRKLHLGFRVIRKPTYMTRIRRDGSLLLQSLEAQPGGVGWKGSRSISAGFLTELCAGIRVKRSLMT